MQDININPVQPSVSETNLNLVAQGGPRTAGINEFTPLFERNRVHVNANVMAGSNDLASIESVASAVYGGLSLSAGGFSYVTDGWRENNDLDQQVYNFYGQWAVTPELNVQAEYRHRATEEGDLAFNFDPEQYSPNRRITNEQDTTRFGLRYSPTPKSTLLLSYIHGDITEEETDFEQFDEFTTFDFDVSSETMGITPRGSTSIAMTPSMSSSAGRTPMRLGHRGVGTSRGYGFRADLRRSRGWKKTSADRGVIFIPMSSRGILHLDAWRQLRRLQ